MIQLNRAAMHDGIEFINDSASDEKIIAVLNYLGEHLTEDISIDTLSAHFFLKPLLSDAHIQRADRLHDRQLSLDQKTASCKGSDCGRGTDHRGLLCMRF